MQQQQQRLPYYLHPHLHPLIILLQKTQTGRGVWGRCSIPFPVMPLLPRQPLLRPILTQLQILVSFCYLKWPEPLAWGLAMGTIATHPLNLPHLPRKVLLNVFFSIFRQTSGLHFHLRPHHRQRMSKQKTPKSPMLNQTNVLHSLPRHLTLPSR